MAKKSANERTFQGELYRIINKILAEKEDIKFNKITQEENIGVGNARFADGLLYSSIDKTKTILFELKNTSWDATDEQLVLDAAQKANNKGYEYFVTGTPRQLVIYQTFMPGVLLIDRKLKLYSISNAKKDDDVLLANYETTITPEIIKFLTDLSNLVHGVKDVAWDSIDRFFVVKLSTFIMHASASMQTPMYKKINNSNAFKRKLKKYLKEQDIFNVTLSFDYDDVFKISQLANYLLYLKIIFYSYLQRELPKYGLKPLTIPKDKDSLNKILRSNFDDVLDWDYQSIFQKTVLDEFEFENDFLPELQIHVNDFKNLDFRQLNADIIGAIYNTLIDNQEQHDRGQHFTNTNEVDIVNAFCINKDTQFITDTSCGAGTFLVRGYYFLKHFNQNLSHEELLERIWGVEIAPFPVFLSTMNLCLLNVKSEDNYPIIINNDFSKISDKSYHKNNFINKSKLLEIKNFKEKKADIKIPKFDACIGNPPYIQQELIENKDYWNKIAEKEWNINDIYKINKQSDLYVYYLYHTATFLKDGKRLGYVISSSWLDVSYGEGFQKFLLDNFKIIAIIDNKKTRSFETASINTVILIIEKCNNEQERKQNNIKFVRIYSDYDNLIGKSDDKNRAEKVISFTKKIEDAKKTIKTKDYFIIVKNQKELEDETSFEGNYFNNKFGIKYFNGHWGAKYLRAPEIYSKIISEGNGKFIPLSKIASTKRGFTTGANDFFYVAKVNYGIKTGANDFFYVKDETELTEKMSDSEYLLMFGNKKEYHKNIWKNHGWYYSKLTKQHHILDKKYLKPLFKSQREAVNLDVDINSLNNKVIICKKNQKELANLRHKLLNYITIAEQQDIHKRPSLESRNIWYNLEPSAVIGDFIFPSKIGEKYRLIDNRKSQVYCDKVNYAIKVSEEYKDYSDIIFLILNSQLFRYFVDLFARQLTGSQTLSDVDVNIVEKTLIIRPELLENKKEELQEIYNSLKSREQGTIFEEIEQEDKKRLDTIIFEALGLTENDREELYRVAAKYIKDRKDKSNSIKTKNKKQKLSYPDALKFIKDRFSEIRTYKSIVKGIETIDYKIPEWKAKYPKDLSSENLFNIYNVYFESAKKQKKLSFENIEQISLFRFLNETLDIKDKTIKIPKKQNDCIKILQILKYDFNENKSLIKNMLKANRSNANYLSIYRDLLMQ